MKRQSRLRPFSGVKHCFWDGAPMVQFWNIDAARCSRCGQVTTAFDSMRLALSLDAAWKARP